MKKRLIRYSLLLPLFLPLLSCHSDEGMTLGSGSFEATEILISSEVSGKVLQWSIEEGATLDEGSYVGLIDTTQLYLQKEAIARSGKGIIATRPNIHKQTAALEIQLADLNKQKMRIEKLLAAGAATEKELEDINTAIASIESQMAALRSTLSKSGAQITAQSSSIDIQIAQIEDMIQRSIIRTPITGTVIANYVRQGELTGAGQPLFRIADLQSVFLRAYIPSTHLAKLKLGDKVKVRVDSYKGDDKEYQGTVTWISPKAEFTPKSVQTEDERANLVYAVKVQVPNDGYIRIGMYGEVVE